MAVVACGNDRRPEANQPAGMGRKRPVSKGASVGLGVAFRSMPCQIWKKDLCIIGVCCAAAVAAAASEEASIWVAIVRISVCVYGIG